MAQCPQKEISSLVVSVRSCYRRSYLSARWCFLPGMGYSVRQRDLDVLDTQRSFLFLARLIVRNDGQV